MSDDKRSKKGLKVNNQASSVLQPTSPKTEEFEKKADEVFSKNEEYKKSMMDLSTKYKSILLDKVLPENKSPLTRNIEEEIVKGLIKTASDMNVDEHQPEAIGALSLGVLCLKMLLHQRDIFNHMSYEVETLKNKVSKLLYENEILKSNDQKK